VIRPTLAGHVVLSLWQNRCSSSPSSSDECRLSGYQPSDQATLLRLFKFPLAATVHIQTSPVIIMQILASPIDFSIGF